MRAPPPPGSATDYRIYDKIMHLPYSLILLYRYIAYDQIIIKSITNFL